jgi:shikimate dehydrogenase
MERLYVLGHPVSHSKSPAMHNALYRELGLDWNYELMDCLCEEDAERFLASANFLGINITMPYKPHAFRRADKADSSAILAQGANVLTWEADVLVAYNMDGYGCVRYLEREGVVFDRARVVVCGTGPTSLAIMHATIVAGATHVTLLGRSAEHAKSVLAGWRARAEETSVAEALRSIELVADSYANAGHEISISTLVVDATPLGMNAGDPAPFDTTLLCPTTTVFDVVYGHGETTLARGAKERGCCFANGEGMLVGQAVLGAERFLASCGVLDERGLDFDLAFKVMARGAGFSVR